MKILFQGDSITDVGRNSERGSTLSIGQGYAMLVTSELGAKFPGKYTFENRGISGNRIVDIYARIKTDGWNLEPDVFSMLIGVNDVWHEISTNNGVEADRFENVYRMLIEDTKKALPDIKFILMEPFVLKASATEENWETFRTEVAKRGTIVKKLCEEYKLTFVPLQEVFNNACESAPADYWLPDGVHPSPAGHRLIADKWLEAFENIK
ncbi:MAG: SGNH/GDSL hydrolase family protein [Clostridia bacterium]|nr:SGNH/GDSL hydrolase family protein [Clostridia bacterium]